MWVLVRFWILLFYFRRGSLYITLLYYCGTPTKPTGASPAEAPRGTVVLTLWSRSGHEAEGLPGRPGPGRGREGVCASEGRMKRRD